MMENVNNFLTEIIDEDIANGLSERIHTRFPPEPNGYLHIGSAKAIFINWSIAKKYNGLFNLRYDDTNPVKEDTEYVDSIWEDIKWLTGEEPSGGVFYGSDYFETCFECAVQLIKDGVDWHVKYKWRNKPEVVLNLVCHGPIERGLDMSRGGVDIVNFACDATALATTANSLAAIEQRVVKEKRLTWEQLVTVLKNDFEGAEDIRLMLKSVPQYGAGGTAADRYAKYLADLYTHMMRDTPTRDGFIVLPGIFSHGDVYIHGKHLGATPNGRHAGGPISHSADPDPGFLPGGGTAPTAKANAVASVQSGWGNSTPLQIDIDAHLAREMGGIENVKAYIRTHDKMGGTLVNINVVSKEKILAAHKDPDLYPDLVVRVTGYSAFFKSLSPEYRQQVVDRWLANG